MSNNATPRDWVHPDFFENQRNFRKEELLQYAGQHIAWAWDGSRVIASAADDGELERKIIDAGHELARVVFDYVPPPDQVLLFSNAETVPVVRADVTLTPVSVR